MGLTAAGATNSVAQAPQLDVKGDGAATRFANGPDSITLQQALDHGNSDIRAMYNFQARVSGFDPAAIEAGSEQHQQVMTDLGKSIEVWSNMPDAAKGQASAWRAFQFAAEQTVTARINAVQAKQENQELCRIGNLLAWGADGMAEASVTITGAGLAGTAFAGATGNLELLPVTVALVDTGSVMGMAAGGLQLGSGVLQISTGDYGNAKSALASGLTGAAVGKALKATAPRDLYNATVWRQEEIARQNAFVGNTIGFLLDTGAFDSPKQVSCQ